MGLTNLNGTFELARWKCLKVHPKCNDRNCLHSISSDVCGRYILFADNGRTKEDKAREACVVETFCTADECQSRRSCKKYLKLLKEENMLETQYCDECEEEINECICEKEECEEEDEEETEPFELRESLGRLMVTIQSAIDDFLEEIGE